MSEMAKITAICNQKGGVGKTVTAVNLGIGLARAGKKVLLVDMDAQGSLTASLGYQRPDQMENTLATILGRIILDEPVSPGEGILHQAEAVDLLPANIELSGLEVTLVNTMSRETILREYLNSVRDQYDVILLDCCPSLGMLTINALAAADEVLIPMQAHYLSIKGLEQLIRTISNVRRKINPRLDIAGILITMADMRTNYSREIVELLRANYGSSLHIFESIIPLSPSKRNRGIDLWEQTGQALGVRPYAEGGIVGETEDTEVPITPSGTGGVPTKVEVHLELSPQFVIEARESGMDENTIISIIKAHIKEMVDDISDELAERLARVFANMPVRGGT